jgi:hypothetical protein
MSKEILMVVDAVAVAKDITLWVFIVLVVLGCWIQTRDRRRPKV